MLLLLAKVITKVQVFLQSFILDGPVKRLKIKHVYYARQTSPQPVRRAELYFISNTHKYFDIHFHGNNNFF